MWILAKKENHSIFERNCEMSFKIVKILFVLIFLFCECCIFLSLFEDWQIWRIQSHINKIWEKTWSINLICDQRKLLFRAWIFRNDFPIFHSSDSTFAGKQEQSNRKKNTNTPPNAQINAVIQGKSNESFKWI